MRQESVQRYNIFIFCNIIFNKNKIKELNWLKQKQESIFWLYITLYIKKMLVCHHYYKNNELFSLQPLEPDIKFYDTTLLPDNTILHFQMDNIDFKVAISVFLNHLSLRQFT